MPSHTWLSYAGGMNLAAINPQTMQADELCLLVNGTVRSGFAEHRPPFRQIEIAFGTATIQQAFEFGICQGMAFYDFQGTPLLVIVADGRLMTLDLTTHILESVLLPSRPFSMASPQVWFQQRGPHMVVQDGVSPPVILTGKSAVQGTASTGVPTGCMMAEGWGRLAVASPGRDKIYFSNHEADPNADILDFKEATEYYKNTRYFAIPRAAGRIVAMEFSPSLNGTADLGPLLVFCERATLAYDVSIPRDEWSTTDIMTTPLPTIGACSSAGVVVRGNDVVFSDHEGRINSLRAAVSRNEDARVFVFDRSVWPLYEGEDSAFRDRRCAVQHDSRILTTVQPERVWRADGRLAVRHRGIIALQESPATPVFPVWDGLWTGIYPTHLVTARLGTETRCFALSLDSDGHNRLYELGGTGHDYAPTPKRIPMLAALRPTDFESPFLPKPFTSAAFKLGAVSGRVSVRGWWQADRQTPAHWFNSEHAVAECIAFDRCGLLDPLPQGLPRINPPTVPKSEQSPYTAAPWIEVTGKARLEEFIIETGETKSAPNKLNTECETPATASAVYECPPNPFAYDARRAPEPATLTTVPCHTHC